VAKLGFVFPGQGSQKIGMLSDYSDEPVVRDCLAEASDCVGYDVWDMIQNGTQETITQTQRTQPILLSCSVALWRLWQHRGGATPEYLAGHSLGEWSALVCAGAVAFDDAVTIVEARGRLMQSAVPVGEGAMAAILGLPDEEIVELCHRAQDGDEVTAVNFNAPGQVVIAGSVAGVERAIQLCKAAGAKRAMPVPVSAPFHTQMMQPASAGLAERLERTTFKSPAIPVVHNVHAQVETDGSKIRQLMLEQIYKPVRWVACIERLRLFGVDSLMECGPGRVLNGLAKRIDKDLNLFATDEKYRFDSALTELKNKGTRI
jgi:[acyl-carrier-protein] S-malonyltransferase